MNICIGREELSPYVGSVLAQTQLKITKGELQFRVNSSGNRYEENGLAFGLKEYDEFAVEQAVKFKEQLGGAPDVTVLSVGPDRVVEVSRNALILGCDRGDRIQDAAPYTFDPWRIASIIVAFAREKGFDLIFTSIQSQDRDSAQVGETVAEHLRISCATAVVGFE